MSETTHERWSEELSAYLLGALEPPEADALERHVEGCERCRDELRWLAPALDALPEAVERLEPPPQLRERLMAEVRADAESAGTAHAPQRRGLLGWLRGAAGPHRRPLVAGAAVLLIAAAVVGYEIGNGGSGGGDISTVRKSEPSGLVAAVVMEGEHGRIKLSNVPALPPDKVLEAWVEREGKVEAVPTLFVPNAAGQATTTLGDMRGVGAVMVTLEPPGGSNAPTSKPITTVPIPKT
jgi:anti-sigma-K factor RskA